jgi:hypothetical protein
MYIVITVKTSDFKFKWLDLRCTWKNTGLFIVTSHCPVFLRSRIWISFRKPDILTKMFLWPIQSGRDIFGIIRKRDHNRFYVYSLQIIIHSSLVVGHFVVYIVEVAWLNNRRIIYLPYKPEYKATPYFFDGKIKKFFLTESNMSFSSEGCKQK